MFDFQHFERISIRNSYLRTKFVKYFQKQSHPRKIEIIQARGQGLIFEDFSNASIKPLRHRMRPAVVFGIKYLIKFLNT